MPLSLITSTPLTLAGRSRTFKIGPDPGIKDLWAQFMQDYGKIAGQLSTSAYGVCHNFDGRGHMDYMCAVAVEDGGQVPQYMHVLQIPARKEAVFIHEGGVETLPQCWSEIFAKHLPEAKLEVVHGPQYEVYGEDQSKVAIHIPVK